MPALFPVFGQDFFENLPHPRPRTSAPPLRVRVTSSSIVAASMTSASGLPSTKHADGTGTIVSPCEPSVSVCTEPTGTPSVVATLLVKRAVSSTPA